MRSLLSEKLFSLIPLFSKNTGIIVLSLLWLLGIVLVNPIGEFPLIDSGLYAHWPKALMDDSSNALQGALAPNLVLQAVWGYLFCQVSGEFSFTALRISTLVLGWLTLALTFKLGQVLFENTSKSLLLTAFLGFNPIFFSLCFTFMTDIPFLALTMGSLLMYAKFFKTQQLKFRLLAFFIGALAFLIRQPAILFIFLFETGIFLIQKQKVITAWNYGLSILGCILLYFFVEFGLKDWLNITEAYLPVTTGFFSLLVNEPVVFFFQLCKRSLMTIFYFGLFSFPFLMLILGQIKRDSWLRKKLFLPILAFNISIMFVLYQLDYTFPYGGVMYNDWRIGPVRLPDVHTLKVTILPQLPLLITVLFGLLCQMFGCYLLFYLLKRIWGLAQDYRNHPTLLLLIAFNCIYLGVMLIYNFFDRYLLLPFLTIGLIILSEKVMLTKSGKKWFFVILCLYVVFALAGTRDYLNWNRAVQKSWTKLEEKGISKEHINAGVAFNDFYKYGSKQIYEPYLITFGEVECYEKMDSIAFSSILWLGKHHIYTLKARE